MLYRGSCWFTYGAVVTYKVDGSLRYVGYTGYRVCDPHVGNPRIYVSTEAGMIHGEVAPSFAGYPDFYGTMVHILLGTAGCDPLFKVGVDVLDNVVFCVGQYGITVAVLIIVFMALLLLFVIRGGG